MRRIVIVAMALLAPGCVSSAWQRLDERARDDWRVCQLEVVRSQCGYRNLEEVGRNLPASMTCIRPLQDGYAAAPPSSRSAWLIRHGCPRDMVESR
jgi:hypothetical protein